MLLTLTETEIPGGRITLITDRDAPQCSVVTISPRKQLDVERVHMLYIYIYICVCVSIVCWQTEFIFKSRTMLLRKCWRFLNRKYLDPGRTWIPKTWIDAKLSTIYAYNIYLFLICYIKKIQHRCHARTSHDTCDAGGITAKFQCVHIR